jgi:hemerythrin superfamily protein
LNLDKCGGGTTLEGPMASDAISLIKHDHRVLEDLFDQVKASKGDRYGLLEEIAALLTAHSRAEEQQVYPAVDNAVPDHGHDLQRSAQEHDEAEELLENALQAVDTAEFDEIFAEFVEVVSHHVEEEESEILPALQQAVDRATLLQLGEEFARAKAEELSRSGFDDDDVDEREHAAAYDRAGADLAGATRDQVPSK